MSGTNKGNSGGIGFTGLLAILFIALKLTGVIDWSWLWVLSPIWIPLALAIIIFSVIGIMELITVLIKRVKDK